MMTDLVVWTGPVYNQQVPGATVPGAKELWLGCVGDYQPGKAHCPTIGRSLAGSLDTLLGKTPVTRATLGDLFFGAFSAGGSIVKRLLMTPDFRDATTAVLLSDATYTSSWVDKGERAAPPIEGFVRYAVDVVNGPGDKLLVATASPIPNGQWATGIENLTAMRREIEKRTGKTFRERDDFWDIEPGPERVWQLGNVVFAEYPLKPIGHNHTRIAPQVWQKILLPWLNKGKGRLDAPGGVVVPPEPPPPVKKEAAAPSWIAFSGGVVLGYLVSSRMGGRR